MTDPHPAHVLPIEPAEAAQLQAKAVYSVAAGPESTASLHDVAKAKARMEECGPTADNSMPLAD